MPSLQFLIIRRPRLTERHKEQRKQFIIKFLEDVRDWKKIVWTDEKKSFAQMDLINIIYIKLLSLKWKFDIKFHFVTPSEVRKAILDHNLKNFVPQIQIVENLFLKEGIRRKSIMYSGVIFRNIEQSAFTNINNKQKQGQVGEKFLLWNDEEVLIEKAPNGTGWQSDVTFISNIREIVIPGIVSWRNQTPRVIDEHNKDLKSKKENMKSNSDREERSLLNIDGHGSRRNRQLMKLYNENRIDELTLPAHSSHKIQPLNC
ncbi:MAG: hypothetical protein EZS28_021304 [Streblomastix strix]|uniref:DDE-1 domain-containing protein n=1 Tax=Streblomastix strix TaxID=222440 RepID=A0A5J4VKP1_9EUKA|nr:MAG: hypothetical protein EZS28_021304 [Streblomastix strix]